MNQNNLIITIPCHTYAQHYLAWSVTGIDRKSADTYFQCDETYRPVGLIFVCCINAVLQIVYILVEIYFYGNWMARKIDISMHPTQNHFCY